MAGLDRLVGEALTDMWRGVYQDFEFGPQLARSTSRGTHFASADLHLVVACSWRVLQAGRLALDSASYWVVDEKDHLPQSIETPRDPSELGKEFYCRLDTGTLAVERVTVSGRGNLRIWMKGGWFLEIMPSGMRHGDWYLESYDGEQHRVEWPPDRLVTESTAINRKQGQPGGNA